MWSRRFERPLILATADGPRPALAAGIVWAVAAFVGISAPVSWPARSLLLLWLTLAVVLEIRSWRDRPTNAVWHPGVGWTLEWPDGSRHAARMMDSTRVFPWLLVLNWSVPSRSPVRLLIFPRRSGLTTCRRLRVLIRYDRTGG